MGVWNPEPHWHSDEILLKQAVRSARTHHESRARRPRWSHVADAFGVGSSLSMALCRRFDLDPEEKI